MNREIRVKIEPEPWWVFPLALLVWPITWLFIDNPDYER